MNIYVFIVTFILLLADINFADTKVVLMTP